MSLYKNESLIGYKPDDGTDVSPSYDDRTKRIGHFYDDFLADAGVAELAPWVTNLHGAGPPTSDYASGVGFGVLAQATEGTSEAQATNLTWGDQLMINMSNNPTIEVRFKLAPAGATLTADERVVLGLGSAHTNAEDALDSVVTNCWFRIEGASLNILVETDDGTTDDDDNDTGIDLVVDTWTRLKIDASDLSDIKFYVDDVLVKVVDTSTGQYVKYSMADLAANTYVQPIIAMQRDAGTEANTLSIDYVKVWVER